ncbi:MAG: hypothetical protein MUC60_02150 [Oscillatoria sp. Prado101]|nr:hypothetical protein [Oscillatoria sp. Prado101]
MYHSFAISGEKDAAHPTIQSVPRTQNLAIWEELPSHRIIPSSVNSGKIT